MNAKAVCIFLGALFLAAPAGAKVIYVDAHGKSIKVDGKSWRTPYRSLAKALLAAKPNDEIWVARGTYYPTRTGRRKDTFKLKYKVSILGGFAGGETASSQRDPAKNKTVLSGDIGRKGYARDNSYHVVTGYTLAVVDGVTITGGYANGRKMNGKGGGVLNPAKASPIFRNCAIVGNQAVEGGGMYNYYYSWPLIENSRIANNKAKFGGGVVFRDGSHGKLDNTLVGNNEATYRGGGVLIDYGASPIINNTAFKGNVSGGHGGAIYIDDRASQIGHTSPLIDNSLFSGNRAKLRGGGVVVFNRATPTIKNSKFEKNHAGTLGGALAIEQYASPVIATSAYVGNAAGQGQADAYLDKTSAIRAEAAKK